MTPHYIVGNAAPLTKLPKTFPTQIDENLFCGIDIGIGSCGIALISHSKAKLTIKGFEKLPGAISFMGVRAFDVPEIKEKSGIVLKNPERRQKRLMRRVLARRASRMKAVKALLIEAKILPADYSPMQDAWRGRHEAATPWKWRVEALNRKLSDWEFAVILMHYAKRRGFKSAKKSDLESKGSEGGTLQSSRANHAALANYLTVADMLSRDPRFVIDNSAPSVDTKKRNRDGQYIAMVTRADVIHEIAQVFAMQRRLGNTHASTDFENRFLAVLNAQRPLQDPIKLLEDCPFVPSEKRGSLMSPSFELARALQKLNTIKLSLPDKTKAFLSSWILQYGGYHAFVSQFGKKSRITWADLRKMWSIPIEITFDDLKAPLSKKKKDGSLANELSQAEKEKHDFSNRSNTKGCAQGTCLLRTVLGETLWSLVLRDGYEVLDDIAFCLTFYEVIEEEGSASTMLGALDQKNLAPQFYEAIANDLRSRKPSLHVFSGSCSISSKALRQILPFLMLGDVYSLAMEKAGFNHVKTDFSLEKITNPIVKAVLREAIKQIAHVFHEIGSLPGRIHIEVARDVGKSMEERNELERGLKTRTDAKNANRQKVAELRSIDVTAVTEDELLRYELYLEQGGLCPYSGLSLPNNENIYGSDLQVDHIQPRSRSHDNSYDNRCLVYASQNQNKGNRTPYEWLSGSDSSWQEFHTRIAAMRGLRRGKRNRLLNETFAENEHEFLERNLNDTRYISRILLAYVQDFYRIAGEEPLDKGATRRVFSRPGQMTSLVRRAWGLENLKKNVLGNRVGDKHHAVDALVCACLSEGNAQWITKISQAYASSNHLLTLRNLQEPWSNFRNDVVDALNQITVSRRERCGAGGPLHKETNYSLEIDSDGKEVAYKRESLLGKNASNKPVANFTTLGDLEAIRGIHHERNQWLKDSLTKWINAGSKIDHAHLPRDPQGCLIYKVSVRQDKIKNLRKQNQGHVVSGTMVRCDVFSKKGKFYLVPVYNYQLASKTPPMRAIVAAKEEENWTLMDGTFQFEFSLWKNSRFVCVDKKTQERIEGCYCGLDRSTGSMTYNLPDDFGDKQLNRISTKTGLSVFQKVTADRLGRVFPVKHEKRIWHGEVCI